MARVLITGGSGMLGSYTAEGAAAAGWETWAAYSGHEVEIPGCRMISMDMRDASAVERAVDEIRPEVIIHTAALVKPDVCERNKDQAFAANVMGAVNMMRAAEKFGAHLVHVSTDLVFDGDKSPYATDQIMCPVNYYGMTKAAAEIAIYSSKAPWAIVRTSIIYGPRKFPFLESFSDKVVESLSAGEVVRAFVDQYRSPIPAWNLAGVLLEIGERRLTGIFHAVCPETTTRLQFARKVAEAFDLDASLVHPILMDEIQTPARRPKMLVLDTQSTSAILNTKLLSFEEGIQELVNRKDAKKTEDR